MSPDLKQDHMYYLSRARSPALELCGDGAEVKRIPMVAAAQGRYADERLWVADLSAHLRSENWQFRVVLASGRRDHPLFAPFYTTSLRTVWVQDRQLFGYKPASTVSPSRVVKLHDFTGSLPPRDLYVYLPRGYEQHRDHTYPVIYMHDGQNCFQAYVHDSFAGSWQADLAADLLIRQGLMQECIIVAVSNGAEDRILEYLPPYASYQPPSRRPFVEALNAPQENEPIVAPPNTASIANSALPERREQGKPSLATRLTRRPLQPIPGRADKTVAYYRDEVSPFIQKLFRVRPGREHTATCGSSMGGLFTTYIAWEFSDFARHHAALSPSYWITRNHSGQMETVERLRTGKPRDVRLWLDSGTRSSGEDGDDGMHDTITARDALLGNGYRIGANLQYYLAQGATHSEIAWATRLPLVFQFLLPVA